MKRQSFEIMDRVEEFHWWFRVRTKLMMLLIKMFAPNEQSLNILDIGCGTGLNSRNLKELGEICSLDNSYDALEFCSSKGLTNIHYGDVRKLPFIDKQFDVVVILDVLEHVSDDSCAVTEIRRVLKQNGLVICFVPAFSFLWSPQDELLGHFRRYTKTTLADLFEEGWECKKISYFNFLLSPFIFLIRLVKKLKKKSRWKDEVDSFPLCNKIFYWIFSSEIFFLKKFNFPFGISLLAVYRKK